MLYFHRRERLHPLLLNDETLKKPRYIERTMSYDREYPEVLALETNLITRRPHCTQGLPNIVDAIIDTDHQISKLPEGPSAFGGYHQQPFRSDHRSTRPKVL